LYEYSEELSDWQKDTILAKKLLAGESAAIHEVVKEMQSFSDVEFLGTGIEFMIEDNFIHALPKIHGDEIVPSFRRKQTASGKLSETKMPKGEFNELYQDYVASVALKVAGDLLQILPLNEIYVTCSAIMLNSKTGHQEETSILSVQFVRNIYERLDLNHLDPSDSLENFKHEMKFTKTKGFHRIERLI